MKKWLIAVFVLILLAVFLSYRSKMGFRGEAIGDRTGGTAYSGAATDLDPGMP
jgi:ribose/xylose/arabinose/galactoside ABC-type transport system permease subunit